MRLPACVASFLLIACAPAKPAEVPVLAIPRAIDLTPNDAPIVLRQSVVADQWFWLRSKLLEGEPDPAFKESLDAMRSLKDDLGGDASAWEDLELPLGTCSNAAELAERFDKLEQFKPQAVRVAKAMVASEQAFYRGPFEQHRPKIQAAARELQARFVAKEPAILDALKSDMQLPNVPSTMTVTLVGEAPYPTAFAADDRGHEIASFVRVGALPVSDLAETILSESLHAYDEITVKVPTAMNMLRADLVRAGLDEKDSNIEMVVNTVTFAEAASLVQRFVDPGHTAMAEGGFFSIYPPAPTIAQAWKRHVEGESIDMTTAKITAAVTQ